MELCRWPTLNLDSILLDLDSITVAYTGSEATSRVKANLVLT